MQPRKAENQSRERLKNKRGCVRNHDTSSFLFHQFVFIDFSSSDYAEFIRRHSCYRLTHGFSRIFGRWPMAGARKVLLLVLSRRFRRWRRFFLRGSFLVPQISQIFTDFFMESLVNHLVHLQGVSVSTEQVVSAKIRE